MIPTMRPWPVVFVLAAAVAVESGFLAYRPAAWTLALLVGCALAWATSLVLAVVATIEAGKFARTAIIERGRMARQGMELVGFNITDAGEDGERVEAEVRPLRPDA